MEERREKKRKNEAIQKQIKGERQQVGQDGVKRWMIWF